MIALIQRVLESSVTVEKKVIGKIDRGMLAFIGVEKTDTKSNADQILKRLLGYRIFSDSDDKMNLSITDINAGLLLVPQFTLLADTQKGMRPSFSNAGSPAHSKEIFQYLVSSANAQDNLVQSGQFAANMEVSLINDGPVTFWLQC